MFFLDVERFSGENPQHQQASDAAWSKNKWQNICSLKPVASEFGKIPSYIQQQDASDLMVPTNDGLLHMQSAQHLEHLQAQ